ncbi:MAG: hypothetical protein Q9184_006586 [Pyrenodesmia sp. 2 TL-2023]
MLDFQSSRYRTDSPSPASQDFQGSMKTRIQRGHNGIVILSEGCGNEQEADERFRAFGLEPRLSALRMHIEGMESLNDTMWDVLLSGTGLPQSLLALALSRSGKKVLHIDRNNYYGGAEASFSLEEAEAWVKQVDTESGATQFSCASTCRVVPDPQSPDAPRLGFSRAYSICLAPEIIYTRSNLIPALVSSKVYRQLEFLAVGSWWIYSKEDNTQDEVNNAQTGPVHDKQRGMLRKIPGGREDVFQDKSIGLRSTRSLMKFLRLAADPEAYPTVLPEWGDKPFSEYLTSQYKIDPKLQAPLLALSLSPNLPSQTTVAYAFPRIHRHLTSIGLFGPGFAAVLPKWGGLAEIAQVACRAGAVGGGVYVLNKGIESIDPPAQASSTTEDPEILFSGIQLQGGDVVKARWVVGTPATLQTDNDPQSQSSTIKVHHFTAIVSSPLTALFPPPAEGSPPPAVVVVVLPSGSLNLPPSPGSQPVPEVPATYLMIHSSDTGECPEGQCIIYTSTTISHPSATLLLQSAINALLDSLNESPKPEILWWLSYTQHHAIPSPSALLNPQSDINNLTSFHPESIKQQRSGILHLQDLAPSLALEDDVLRDVRAVWERITADDGDARGGFLQFEDRAGLGGDDGDDL